MVKKVYIYAGNIVILNCKLMISLTILSFSSSMAAMSLPNSLSEEAMMISSSVCRFPMHSNLNSTNRWDKRRWHEERAGKMTIDA